MKEGKDWTRREILAMGTGVTALLSGSGFAQVTERTFTQSIVMGPFYPQIKPLDQDADLTIVNGRKTRAKGRVIHVAGRVSDPKGVPIRDAKMEIWQADANGRYAHKSDPNPAELDDGFQGYCVLRTD